jgi:hypothetical protein
MLSLNPKPATPAQGTDQSWTVWGIFVLWGATVSFVQHNQGTDQSEREEDNNRNMSLGFSVATLVVSASALAFNIGTGYYSRRRGAVLDAAVLWFVGPVTAVTGVFSVVSYDCVDDISAAQLTTRELFAEYEDCTATNTTLSLCLFILGGVIALLVFAGLWVWSESEPRPANDGMWLRPLAPVVVACLAVLRTVGLGFSWRLSAFTEDYYATALDGFQDAYDTLHDEQVLLSTVFLVLSLPVLILLLAFSALAVWKEAGNGSVVTERLRCAALMVALSFVILANITGDIGDICARDAETFSDPVREDCEQAWDLNGSVASAVVAFLWGGALFVLLQWRSGQAPAGGRNSSGMLLA